MKLLNELILQKQIKEGEKITQADVGRKLGISQARLHLIVNGEASCARSPDLFEKIAKYFDLEPEELKRRIKEKADAARE